MAKTKAKTAKATKTKAAPKAKKTAAKKTAAKKTAAKKTAAKKTAAKKAAARKTSKARKPAKKRAAAAKAARTARDDGAILKAYEQALKALYDERWGEAAKLFEQVIAGSEHSDLNDRARRYLQVCRRRLGKGAQPDPEDPFLAAVVERNRGNLEEALSLAIRGGRAKKDDRFAFLAASICCLTGDLDKAAEHLAQAIELNPKNRVYAFHDSDFQGLRESADHAHLFR